jgi:hypothetical protein
MNPAFFQWLSQVPPEVLDWLTSFPAGDFIWISRVPLMQVLSALRSFPSGGNGDVFMWGIDTMANYPGISGWLSQLPSSLVAWFERAPQSLWIWAKSYPT